jgi:hypothetical protein
MPKLPEGALWPLALRIAGYSAMAAALPGSTGLATRAGSDERDDDYLGGPDDSPGFGVALSSHLEASDEALILLLESTDDVAATRGRCVER